MKKLRSLRAYLVLAAVCMLIWPLHRLSSGYLNEESIGIANTFAGLFAILTALFILVGNYVASVSKAHIHLTFLATQVIRMLFGFGLLGFVFYEQKPTQTTEVAFAFIFWYLIFTLVEINAFLINLRPDFDR